jgi:hypothetical protein
MQSSEIQDSSFKPGSRFKPETENFDLWGSSTARPTGFGCTTKTRPCSTPLAQSKSPHPRANPLS